ncbi:MAG: FtsH protease activity modulator HflK [Desulfobacteraceae bacterium]
MNWDWDKLREKKEKYESSREGRQGGGGGGMPTPPNFDEFFNKMKNFRFTGIIAVLIILLLIFFGNSMIYQVELDEVGVVQRFGQFNRISQPGLHFKLPAGVEDVKTVMVKRIRKEEFGFETVQGADDSVRFSDDNAEREEALMLTGDLNVAIVPWIVQYRIADPYNYLFKVKNVKSLLRDMSQSTMRTVVGDRSITEVISERIEIAQAATKNLQKEMNEAEAGVNIVTIEMKKTNVPKAVQPSFNKVNAAIQEKEQIIYKAREEYNKAVPAARGEARRVIKDAEGYAIERVNKAQGDVAKFKSIYKEYAKARQVTETRLYLEAMSDVIPKMGKKYVIDSEQKNLLPFLPMGDGGVTGGMTTNKNVNK